MAECRVVMRCDCNVSCLDTSGYVTARNSRLISRYHFCGGGGQQASRHEQYDKICVI
jgi:hypothetical protein